VSKGDQARDGVVLGVRPAADPLLDPVAALDDWLAVLDAAAAGVMAAGELPLIVRCPRGANLILKPVTYNWMWRHFDELQRRAGLSGFSPHSTRTGFAVTAADAKATSDQLRRVMRHRKVNAAVAYVLSRAARRRPAPLAVARAAGAA
jgi:integrase